jgi:4-hydroxyacetophenone monooxygenase
MAEAAMAHQSGADSEREAFIRRAVETANSNALRLALYQLTGDPELAAMRPYRKEIRGGAMLQNVVRDEDLPSLREKAVQYLLAQEDPVVAPPAPDDAEKRRLIKIFNAQTVSENYMRFGIEELAYEDFPRDAKWTARPAPEVLAKQKVLIIGGGISGIAAAIQLKRLGLPHVVIERQADIGGTWHINNYPEARVDTSSFLYQFKFEKNYPWPEFFAARDESKRYLNHIANKYGILDAFRFNTEVTSAKWDEDRALWMVTLRTQDGGEETIEANFIISGSGLFATPNLPDIPGIEGFQGRMFHTAQWDHSYDYSGKRIALIGTGSSGTQLMPALAKAASQLTVYQRTPNWIMQLDGYRAAVPEETQWLFEHLPFYWNWYSYSSFDTALQLQNSQTYDHEWRKTNKGVNAINAGVQVALTDYIRTKLASRPDLIEKCTPPYPPLARRLVVDNGFYDALLQPNVELVTEGIEAITPNGIKSKDGGDREFDLIVLGAGFKVTDFLWPIDYVGRDGLTLPEAWKKDGARSYVGAAMPGFPNLLMFYGPNGQPRSGGFYSWAEIWSRYAATVIIKTIEGGKRVAEVTQEAFDDYNAKQDAAMKEVLWEVEGAGGYYNNRFGRCGANVPFLTEDYHAMVTEPDMDHFELR